MSDFDIEAVRAQVRAMDFVHGSPAEIAMWREDMAESRANLVIEDMIPTPNDDAFFDMLLGEGVSPPRVANPAPAARSSRRRSILADHANAGVENSMTAAKPLIVASLAVLVGCTLVAPPPVVQSAAPPVMAGTNASIVTVRVDFALQAR
jgi:hypothetical protein